MLNAAQRSLAGIEPSGHRILREFQGFARKSKQLRNGWSWSVHSVLRLEMTDSISYKTRDGRCFLPELIGGMFQSENGVKHGSSWYTGDLFHGTETF